MKQYNPHKYLKESIDKQEILDIINEELESMPEVQARLTPGRTNVEKRQGDLGKNGSEFFITLKTIDGMFIVFTENGKYVDIAPKSRIVVPVIETIGQILKTITTRHKSDDPGFVNRKS